MDDSTDPRVVSLLPSATEIVYALGVEPVATSHECDHPPAATELPSVVSSRIDADASSAEIDAQVLEAGDVYEIDRERLAAVDPEFVISQGICEVCAVDTVVVREAIDELGLDCELLTTDPHSVDDVLGDVERIGDALGRRTRAESVVSELEARIAAVESRTERIERRPTVVVLDWLDPVMVAGHWVPELVESAGGRYPLAAPGDASTPREWAEIRRADPDVLVAAPCGFDLEQTFENVVDVADRPGFESLRAVRNGRVHAVDGHHLMNRPGPRVVDTLETLASIVHPDLFDPTEEWTTAPLFAPA